MKKNIRIGFMEIIPAVLPQSFEELREKAESVRGLVNTIQVDICDGKFVDNVSWPYSEINSEEFSKLLLEVDGLPEWESLDYEVDLMTENQIEDFRNWIKIGAKRIVLHFEALENPIQDLDLISDEYGYFPKSDSSPFEIGLAINVNTDVSELKEIINKVDFIQIMGITYIGHQGEKLNEEVFNRIEDLLAIDSDLIISIDGGVNVDNASKLIERGASRLVCGSSVFGEGDIRDNIERLENSL